MTETPKRLYRSRTDRKLLGVCGGIAEYLVVDPTIIRLVWIIVTLVTVFVPGLLAYFIAGLIIPEAPLSSAPARPSSPPAAPPPS